MPQLPDGEHDLAGERTSEAGADMTSRVLTGSAFILTGRIINATSLFIVSMTLARVLGPDRYGLIAVAMGISGMLEVVGALGLNTGAARYIPFYQARGETDDIRRVVSINLTAKVGMGVMLGALIFLLADPLDNFFNKPIAPLLKIAALVLGVNILGGAFSGLLRGLQHLGAMALANVCRDLVWLSVSIALVLVADLGPEGALWGFVAGAVVWVVISGIAMARYMRSDVPSKDSLEERYDPKVIRLLVAFGVPVLLSNLLFMIFDWTGTYVIAYYRPVADVSVYNIAFGVVSIPLILTQAIGMAMLPAMSQAYGAGRMGLVRTLWGGSLKIVNLVLFPFSFLLMLLAAPAVLLVYGADYVPGAVPLTILAVWLLFRPTGAMSTHLLASMALQRLIFRVNLISVGINIFMSIALVPRIGINGAAYATTTAFFVNASLLYYYARRESEVRMDVGATLRTAFSAAAAAVFGWTLYHLMDGLGEDTIWLFARLAWSVIAALGVYLLAVRGLGVVSEGEVENMRAVAERNILAKIVLKLLAK